MLVYEESCLIWSVILDLFLCRDDDSLYVGKREFKGKRLTLVKESSKERD